MTSSTSPYPVARQHRRIELADSWPGGPVCGRPSNFPRPSMLPSGNPWTSGITLLALGFLAGGGRSHGTSVEVCSASAEGGAALPCPPSAPPLDFGSFRIQVVPGERRNGLDCAGLRGSRDRPPLKKKRYGTADRGHRPRWKRTPPTWGAGFRRGPAKEHANGRSLHSRGGPRASCRPHPRERTPGRASGPPGGILLRPFPESSGRPRG